LADNRAHETAVGEVMSDRIARFTELIERERETMEELAQRVAVGETLVEVCLAWDVPYGRVMGWLVADAARREVYEGAQAFYADAIAAQTVRIADDEGGGNHLHSAQKIKARQWLAGKYARGRFGDAVVVEHTGETVVRLSFGGRTVPSTAVVVPELVAIQEDGSGEI
jgi:hypothetical protein